MQRQSLQKLVAGLSHIAHRGVFAPVVGAVSAMIDDV
jgi:hypothetical protein